MEHHYFESIEETNLPELVQESFRDKFEMAHLRRLDDHLYLILNYPKTNDYNRTICLITNGTDLRLYAPSELKSVLDKFGSLTDVISGIVDSHELSTQMIYTKVEEYEAAMEELVDKTHVSALYRLQKEMIFIESEATSLERMMDILNTTKPKGFYNEDDLTDYASVLIDTHQIIGNVKMYQMMIDSLLNSSQSLFSNKLNETMKRLTSITLIFSVPIFITGFFGMNIDIPYAEHPRILLYIFISSIILMWTTIIYFHKKDLL